jgi:hypothetical protein
MSGLRHDPERYDEHLVLKVPVTLWLGMLFLLRHLLLLGITFMPTTGQEITVLRDLVRPEYLISDLIALPVVIAALRRRPRAPRWMRRLWPLGRALLTLSALSYLALLGRTLALSGKPMVDALDEPALISALLGAAVIAYLWRSALVRDLFREFPADDRPTRSTEGDRERSLP